MPHTNPTTIQVGGLPATVYGLSALSTSPSPHGLTILFWLHGRLGSAALVHEKQELAPILAYAAAERNKGREGRDLLVVTIDHRNHGERLVDLKRNKAWAAHPKEGLREGEFDNASHAVDMYSIQTGTARDVSFLVDFLPAVLFPQDDRVVTNWAVAGVSLGGHSTWLSLAHEPRLTLGIPIIGSPSTLALLSHRAQHLPPPLGPLPITAPHFPSTLLSLIAREDPVNVSAERWSGKKILVLSGGEDTLVNYVEGASEAFVERLKGEGVDVSVWVQDGVGHRCSREMLDKAAAFVWENALKVEAGKL